MDGTQRIGFPEVMWSEGGNDWQRTISLEGIAVNLFWLAVVSVLFALVGPRMDHIDWFPGPKRRVFQFSLRTLLIAVGVSAGAMSLTFGLGLGCYLIRTLSVVAPPGTLALCWWREACSVRIYLLALASAFALVVLIAPSCSGFYHLPDILIRTASSWCVQVSILAVLRCAYVQFSLS